MMKLRFPLILIGLAMAFVMLEGCRTTEEPVSENVYDEAEKEDVEMFLPKATEIGENMLNGLIARDYERTTRDWASELKMTPEGFEAYCDDLSKKGTFSIGGYEYLTMLEHPPWRTLVWKLEFLPKENAAPRKKPLKVDAIFRIVVGKRNGEYVIVGFYLN